ncbi:hypothetical protein ZYGR_0AS01460 [Zygosaccharomyces rouxii]|uniref:Transcription activator GCR1-like domain-containing protein n=1 Tax=Zygosaccharomyces rouxii TaxID=4956 RepID=A0A1Q3AH68_ZYGRO|nr:hypothetical protein ZYGR_0AS01460 [Zygosaccharomyces rouxii]
MRSAAVEEKMDSTSSPSGRSGKNGFDELVRSMHDGNDDDVNLKEGNFTSQEYIQKLVSESLKTSFISPFDKVADDSEFHYTSSFKARPQAEYFDFDEKYMYKPERKREKNNDHIKFEKHHEVHQSEYEDEDVDMEVVAEEGGEENQDVDGADDDLQSVIDAVSLCKTIFGDMINKIDKVALTSMTYKTTKMGFTQLDREMTDILDTVRAFVPHSETELLSTTQQLQQSHVATRSTPHLALDAPNNIVQGPLNSLRSDPCAHLPNFGVILIKSPASVSQLWDEYTKIPAEWPVKDLFTFTLLQQGGPNNVSDIELITKRRTSIKQLEASLGSSWRNADKNFSRQINRRKKIWKPIEEGLSDGLSLEDCFSILENYVKNKGKGLSWYYNGVPFKLSDVYGKLPADKKK